jgi:WD40 repeat protein
VLPAGPGLRGQCVRRARIVLCSLWMATSAPSVAGQVATRLELAALCVRWSPCGCKFAIGAAKTVCVAYRDGDKGWWVAKLMRRCHSSSIMAVAWHPGGALLATASSDGRCRVFNARVAGALSMELMTETVLNITHAYVGVPLATRLFAVVAASSKLHDVSVTDGGNCGLVRRSALGRAR